jgi:class 3 adenylate cyclase/tetratricopeptide (TPR) repeat protein
VADAGGIVALLFTDLVGSTSMYDRIGDERAEAVRRAHFAGLRDVVAAHGGQEVKSLGDGLMVTFTSAVAAVEAAVEMQRSAGRHVADPDHRPEIRVGLHAGEPLRDEEDYFGVSVNVAKRLCDAAGPGQILASSLIRALVSPRLRSGLRPAGELALKGIEEPVDAYLVDWTPAAPGVDLPALLVAAADRAFVGRDAELDELRRRWRDVSTAATPKASVALVAGEPGIGKTRLVRELVAEVAAGPGLVLAGRCSDELVVPLEPFAEAFRHAVATWPADASAALTAPEIEPLLRPSGQRDGLPDTERHRLFAAVTETLVAVSARSPLVLVLDDLHWADESSLRLLHHLVRSATCRLLVVGTYRDTEVARGHPLASLLADLRREPSVARLALRGLAQGDVRRLLAGDGRPSGDEAKLADRITAETEGNPFFVGEILRHLVEQGHLTEVKEGDGAGSRLRLATMPDRIDVPEGIREVVGRRLTRLSQTANEALAVASVIGRQFPARLLADLADLTLDGALDVVDEAMQARLVQAGDGPATFAFSHALIRETLLGEVSAVRRMRLHLRIGEAMAASGAPIAEVAHHLVESGAIGDQRTMAEAALAAAEDARFRLAAFEDAASIAGRALAVLEASHHEDLRCDLLTVRGDSQIGGGDYGGIETLREAAELAVRLADPARIARAVTYALRAGVPKPQTAPFVEASLEALRLFGDEPSPVRTRLRTVLALSGETDGDDDRDTLTREVLDEARAADDDEAVLYATLARADLELALGNGPAAEALLDEGVARIGPGLTEAELPFGSRYFELALLIGDRDRAEIELQRIESNRHLFNTSSWTDRLPRAGFALLDGHLAEAAELAAAEFDSRMGALQAAAILGIVALEQDQAATMLPVLEAEAAKTGLAAWRAGVALFLLEAGRADEARRWTTGVLDQLGAELGSATGLAIVAEVAGQLEDPDLARGTAAALDHLGGRTLTSGVLCFGATDRYRGLCAAAAGDLDRAIELLDRGRATNLEVPAPLYAGHAAVDLATLLRRRDQPGDAERADELLDEAREVADRLHLPRLARRAGARRSEGGRAPAYD